MLYAERVGISLNLRGVMIMGKQEKVNAMMHKIAEALPDESSPELTAIMLINIVLLYEQEHN